MKDRILKIIDFYKLNGAAFAVKVGIKDSQLSHIKSGRNEPSLDIVTKILENCPEISSDWLLFGSGDMVKNVVEKTVTQPFKPQKEPIQLSMIGLFDSDSIKDTNNETEIKEKTNVETNKVKAADTSSVSVENEPLCGVNSSVQSTNSQSSNHSSTSVENQPILQPKEKSNAENEQELGISFTKQELLDLLTAVQRPKVVESSEKKENLTEIEKTQASQSPRIKKIIVYYSDKSYEEFMPAQ